MIDRSPRRACRVLAGWLETLVPAACVGCRRAVAPGEPPLCRLCRARLPKLPTPRCHRCAEPLGRRPPLDAPFGGCGLCDAWPGAVIAARAPFAFEGPAGEVVRALKLGKWRVLAPLMAAAMAPAAEEVTAMLGPPAPRLVPVPLAPPRLRERGFNQAADLANALSALGIGAVHDLLERRPGGAKQARSSRADRAANVRGRFAVSRRWSRGGGGGRPSVRPVLLVDDVLTTGATAHACAEALGEAGFDRIGIVTFARTLRPIDG